MADQFITVKEDFDRLFDKNMDFLSAAPEVEQSEVDTMAEIFSKSLKQYLRIHSDDPDALGDSSGRLRNSIKTEDVSVGDGKREGLFIDYENNGVNVAAWHEFAPLSGHEVGIGPSNPEIHRWAEEKLGENLPSYITVTPNRFVKPVARETGRKVRNHVKQGGNVEDYLEEHYG